MVVVQCGYNSNITQTGNTIEYIRVLSSSHRPVPLVITRQLCCCQKELLHHNHEWSPHEHSRRRLFSLKKSFTFYVNTIVTPWLPKESCKKMWCNILLTCTKSREIATLSAACTAYFNVKKSVYILYIDEIFLWMTWQYCMGEWIVHYIDLDFLLFGFQGWVFSPGVCVCAYSKPRPGFHHIFNRHTTELTTPLPNAK